MEEQAAAFGLQINWSKTKIIQFSNPHPCSTVQVADGLVEVANSFVYLGSMIDSTGGSRGEILRRIGLAQTCMNFLEKGICKSSIRRDTKLRLYQKYVVPVLMYDCEKHGPPCSFSEHASMHLTCGPSARFLEFHISDRYPTPKFDPSLAVGHCHIW